MNEEQGILPPQRKTSFVNSLLVIPLNWDEVIARLQRSGIVDAIRPLLEWLPTQQNEYVEELSPNLRHQRENLRDFAEKLVYAERVESEDFLATIPLRRLASDYHRTLPITVIVGAKGSGKTYTFLQIVRRVTWQAFVQAASDTQSEINAVIFPVLASKNLDDRQQLRLLTVESTHAKTQTTRKPRM